MYESNYTTAVLLEQRNLRLRGLAADAKTAGEVINVRIQREGIDAVLPQYARFVRRNAA
ncbi:MAG: hypothetical protein IIA05_08245 [Proteobacteria bacterium]|nr:hypothetical protein [Pseudomonadota bacterium]